MTSVAVADAPGGAKRDYSAQKIVVPSCEKT